MGAGILMEASMGISFGDYMAKVPQKRQQAIKKRAAELIAEEATLRQVIEARERSLEDVTKKPSSSPEEIDFNPR